MVSKSGLHHKTPRGFLDSRRTAIIPLLTQPTEREQMKMKAWRRLLTALGLALGLTGLAMAEEATAASDTVRVTMETSLGRVVMELYPEKAPETVVNFLGYVDKGFYDGTIFHRVIPGFMAQGGGFTQDYQRKQTGAAIKNEADNGLRNDRGTVAMARTNQPHSATSQFFINLVDNDFLNHTARNPRGWGYCVFGKVIEGMDVVDQMAKVPTGAGGPFQQNLPKEPIVIERMSR